MGDAVDFVVSVAPGTVVGGRYEIRREIARGAMGVVYEAMHETLRSAVALKMLTPAASEWSAGVPRLLREARMLALCRHPHVVAVHDAGTCPAHGPFVALERLEGRSLDSLVVARGGLDPAGVARVGAQLASALAHVHGRGVLHRDLKPANVMITRGGPSGDDARLIDFGVAVSVERAASLEPKLTATDELLGTIEFMAPELLLHEAGPSFASDVYSLGVLLFEALTGQLPFPGRATAIISAHASGLTAPRAADAREGVSPELSDVIAGALARHPEERITLAELERACAQLAARHGATSLVEPPAPVSMAARRQFARVPYNAPIRLVTAAGAIDGRTEDISEGGVLAVVAGECGEGEAVTIRFPLPVSGRVVLGAGVARWIRSQRGRRAVGIAFHTLGAEALAEVRAYVELMSRGAPREGLAKTSWSDRPRVQD